MVNFFTINFLIYQQEISGLEKGIEYEFRVAGVNNVGPGQVPHRHHHQHQPHHQLQHRHHVHNFNLSVAGDNKVLPHSGRRPNGCPKEHHLEVPGSSSSSSSSPPSSSASSLSSASLGASVSSSSSSRFQTPDVVEIVYDAPPEHSRNGQIVKYEIQFWKGADPNKKKLRQTTDQKTVFANLDDNTE